MLEANAPFSATRTTPFGTTTPMQFADKIKRLIDERGWDQAELSRRAAVDQATMSRWINGGSRPRFDATAVRLGAALGVPLDYLADDAQDEPPPPAAELPRREAIALEMVRALDLSTAEVIRRLAGDTRAHTVEGITPAEVGYSDDPDAA
jgi:transcriptional regulator with XRE-family HTH domain